MQSSGLGFKVQVSSILKWFTLRSKAALLKRLFAPSASRPPRHPYVYIEAGADLLEMRVDLLSASVLLADGAKSITPDVTLLCFLDTTLPPYPILSLPTLNYPFPPYLTLPYPTLPYPTLPADSTRGARGPQSGGGH